jgi:hypothetical protein
MSLEVCWDGLWTLSFGLSQLHSHGSWLVCEVALRNVSKIKAETPIHDNIRELVTWECKEHGVKS